MPFYVLSEAVEAELFEIHAYIAQYSPIQAQLVLLAFFDRFQRIADAPMLSRQVEGRPQFRVSLSSGKTRSYRVVFQEKKDHVEILRILHGARDQEGELGDSPSA